MRAAPPRERPTFQPPATIRKNVQKPLRPNLQSFYTLARPRFLPFATEANPMAKTRIPLNQDWVKQQQRQQWLDSAVAELDLDVRTINGLEEDGILYVRELVQCTRQDLMKVTNFGQTTVTRVVKVLDNLGLHLRGDAP
ncbi:hypothetical protein FYK55_02560 [Roseiconus nitratireducens]|uniref:RNA polymerase alpha subunit C-terminal domain-containing protein n=2 Tax=Roseiconus nitratireducens TaxID=2605748 RepID=A0A5M6DI91_9BACT|nr:hypothetical protein FYK55_02560 [Roseiconus nitratireducens]